MKKRQTLYFIASDDEVPSALRYVQDNAENEGIWIAAPRLLPGVLPQSLAERCISRGEEAWAIDYAEVCDRARRCAFSWYSLPEVRKVLDDCGINLPDSYPLMAVMQGNLYLQLVETFQCYEYCSRLFEKTNPDKVVVSRAEDLYRASMAQVLEDGLERSIVRWMATQSGVEIEDVDDGRADDEAPCGFASRFRAAMAGYTKSVGSLVSRILGSSGARRSVVRPGEGIRVLLFAWGDYYINQILGVIDELIGRGCSVTVALKGGTLSHAVSERLRNAGVTVTRHDEWASGTDGPLGDEWKAQGERALERLAGECSIHSMFSTEHGSLFPEIVSHFLRKELVDDLPEAAIGMTRSGRIIDATSPDIVVAQFSVMPAETADVIAARRRGVRTIGLEHGFRGHAGVERNVYTTEYFAANGELSRQAMMHAFDEPGDKVYSCGNPYYEKLRSMPAEDKRAVRKKHGLDPERPLMIYCDTSQWPQNSEWRCTSSRYLEAILAVKNHVPGLQIIHRIHHGMDYCDLQRFYERLGDLDIRLQNSLLPYFRDIVAAADVVVSHNSSSIVEAIARRVPVIYLCAISDAEQCYLNSGSMIPCEDLENLPRLVAETLQGGPNRDETEQAVNAFCEEALCGLDGESARRIAEAIIDAAGRERQEHDIPTEDVVRRIRRSCEFSCAEWRSEERRATEEPECEGARC